MLYIDEHASIPLDIHLVGSMPLPDAAATFRKLTTTFGPCLRRMPDGETGVRRSWIRFLQDVLAEHPALEIAAELPPFRFMQWDGKVVREIPRLRVAPGETNVEAEGFVTGYADMALASWRTFASLRDAGVIAPGVKFQISLPTPIAPTYNNVIPADRGRVLHGLTQHFLAELATITAALPQDRIAVQWDVCQEVLALEGYYEPGPVDFRAEALAVLTRIGDAVPRAVELGFHLCYGSPADEHLVQPKDTAVMVDLANAIAASLSRPIDFVHMPVPKARTDDAYFAPLRRWRRTPGTALYLGLIHHDDGDGDVARFAAAARHVRVDGIGTECGMARGDPARLDALLASHRALLDRAPEAGREPRTP